MKGIVLAGGLGTRLYPSSHVTNKHLLPVYDKPMIYYPLSTLLLAGIKDILIIRTPQQLPSFKALLNDGNQWGVNFSYAAQPKPEGIAQTFLIGEKFINNSNVCLILGDNIFQGSGLEDKLRAARNNTTGATIFAYYVENPQHYGVVEFDKNQKPLKIIEKPSEPKSNYAITGLYFYDQDITEIAKSIKPSARNELEISDINHYYLEKGKIRLEMLGRGFTWLDMGTHKSLLNAANFIEVIESRQGLKIGCPEEIAWRKGYINDQQLEQLALTMIKNSYGEYLLHLLQNRI